MATRLRDAFRLFLYLPIFALIADSAEAAPQDRGFVDRVLHDETGAHRYVVFVPPNYAASKEWPVILFLHSAGDRGTDGRAQLAVGLAPAIRRREATFPFIAVFPQCEDRDAPARGGWLADTADARRALAMLAEVERTYRTDKDRVYLTGISMGGFGAWSLAAADPDRWAAVVPISGGGDPATAEKLARLPVWCFHGAQDRIVPVHESRQMIDAIKKAGGRPRYTERGASHNVWDAAYGSDELVTWLLAQRRGLGIQPAATETAPRSPRIAPRPEPAAPEGPFVPTLEISHAVFVRLGREFLDALADSIPSVIPADALSGRLADAQQNTTAEGMAVTVQLRGISYRGRVSRAVIEPRSNDRIAVTLAVRDVNLVINRTNIWGDISATAGPLRIVLGHRADLPISFEVRPVIENRRLRLKLLGTQFRLPRDNWYVGSPEWVNASGGLFVTNERVASGLRNGLYSDPGRIEREVVAAVPRLLEQLEDRLTPEPIDRIVADLWPLPVYKPRLRSWPAAVEVDEAGATIALGVSVAAFDPKSAPRAPKHIRIADSDVVQSVGGERFRFGLAPDLMEPLALEVVADDAARAHVSDMPMPKLHELGDPDILAEIAPDLTRHGDVQLRAELRLTGPLRLSRGEGEAAEAIVFDMPNVRCSIAIRAAHSDQWLPFLEIDAGLRHAARPSVQPPTPSTRVLALEWLGQPAIDTDARFAPDYEARDNKIDVARIHEIVAAAWQEWTEAGALAKVPLEDLDLGFSKLRADRVGWDGDYLATTFAPAGLVIRNLTDQPIVYEMKGPYSNWGGPYRLELDEVHRYPIAYPVSCRFRSAGAQKVYTLPAGARFEFQGTDRRQIELYASREEPTPEVQSATLEAREEQGQSPDR